MSDDATAIGAPAPHVAEVDESVAPATGIDATPVSEVEVEGKQTETEDKTGDEHKEEAAPASADNVTVSVREKAEQLADAPAEEKKARRKSTGVPEHKGKKLNKKQSIVKLTHPDAQPGDYFFVKMKGYPLWPGIIASDDMLPKTLLDRRPATARREDGSWREDAQDGGKNVGDRTFPFMYLHTNEFSWVRNTDLVDLDLDTVGETNAKMRKDLVEAHTLAAEKHDLDYFKGVLRDFQEMQLAVIAEKEAKKKEKEAAAAEKKKTITKRKSKSNLAEAATDSNNVDEDVDMDDADASGDLDPEEPKKASKKRKAEDGSSTPARSDSVKKPKIKINNTPKATNGDTPKASAKKEAKPKVSKSKKSNGATNGDGSSTPQEPELTEEEKRAKKEKEILFLRHKLQKGLLTKDQAPKEEEMKQMSEYISKLEGYADLEVSIIRVTKINKVLKALLKLEEIPKEAEYKFKARSQSLLEKWTKILDSEVAPSAGTPVPAVEEKKELTNGNAKTEESAAKDSAESKPAATSEDSPMVDAPVKEADAPETAIESEKTIEPPAVEAASVEPVA